MLNPIPKLKIGLLEDIGKTSKTEPSESLVCQSLLGFWLWLRFLVTLEVGFGLSMSNSYSTLLRASVPKETTIHYLLLTGRPAGGATHRDHENVNKGLFRTSVSIKGRPP